MGFSEEQIEAALPAEEDVAAAGDFELLTKNWPTLEVFLGCADRWDRNEWNGRVIAINAPAMESVMNMLRIPDRDRPRVFRDLIAMQNAARPVMNRHK